MYKLYFEDLNLKIFLDKRYILHEMLQVTCWSGTRFGFYQYQWPAGPVADPCSCSSGTQLDPGRTMLVMLLSGGTFYNLIVSFGDPVKILGPPPVGKLQARSPTSQPGRNKIKQPTGTWQLFLTPGLEILPTI